MPNLDRMSISAVKLEMLFNEMLISTGTGFFWHHHDDCYLVTNWHNLSGIDAITKKNLDVKNACRPNKIRFQYYSRTDPNFTIHLEQALEIDGVKLWLEHPVYQNTVDVACMKIKNVDKNQFLAMNSPDLIDGIYGVSDDVFVLGFPLGIHVRNLPAWKRATLASEPDINVDGDFKILVDTAGSKGMSGSPVIFYSTNVHKIDGSFSMGTRKQAIFVGVYSGRVNRNDSLEAQLGIVWKKELIDEIINGPMEINFTINQCYYS